MVKESTFTKVLKCLNHYTWAFLRNRNHETFEDENSRRSGWFISIFGRLFFACGAKQPRQTYVLIRPDSINIPYVALLQRTIFYIKNNNKITL